MIPIHADAARKIRIPVSDERYGGISTDITETIGDIRHTEAGRRDRTGVGDSDELCPCGRLTLGRH
jgi:hypothetical protein